MENSYEVIGESLGTLGSIFVDSLESRPTLDGVFLPCLLLYKAGSLLTRFFSHKVDEVIPESDG